MYRSHRMHWIRGAVRFGAFGLLLYCFSPLTFAQNCTVYGLVRDIEGKASAGISVVLENSTYGFHQTTITAMDGSFRFREVPPASGYQVSAIVHQQIVAASVVNLN